LVKKKPPQDREGQNYFLKNISGRCGIQGAAFQSAFIKENERFIINTMSIINGMI
jgi:hypothetical protein